MLWTSASGGNDIVIHGRISSLMPSGRDHPSPHGVGVGGHERGLHEGPHPAHPRDVTLAVSAGVTRRESVRGVRTVQVVGIGLGDPGQLTLDAVEALGGVDVVVLLHKPGPADELTAIRAGDRRALRAAGPGGRARRRRARPRLRRLRGRHRALARRARGALRADPARRGARRRLLRPARVGRPGDLRRHRRDAPPPRRPRPGGPRLAGGARVSGRRRCSPRRTGRR